MKHYCKSFELVSCLLYLILFVDSRTRQKKKPRGWWHPKERFSHPVYLDDNERVNTGNKGTIKQAIDWFKARDIASYSMRDKSFRLSYQTLAVLGCTSGVWNISLHVVLSMGTLEEILETKFKDVLKWWDVLNPLRVINYNPDEDICDATVLRKKFK